MWHRKHSLCCGLLSRICDIPHFIKWHSRQNCHWGYLSWGTLNNTFLKNIFFFTRFNNNLSVKGLRAHVQSKTAHSCAGCIKKKKEFTLQICKIRLWLLCKTLCYEAMSWQPVLIIFFFLSSSLKEEYLHIARRLISPQSGTAAHLCKFYFIANPVFFSFFLNFNVGH